MLMTSYGFKEPQAFMARLMTKGISETHAHRELELEGGSLKEGSSVVIAAGGEAIGATLLHVHAVNEFDVA